jgi:hypothetical protein
VRQLAAPEGRSSHSADILSRSVSYAFEDLDDSQFERLVIQCMRKLFGAGVQEFAAGPDGGRDARFYGTAELFPSRAEPWSGLVVGQAKHTAAVNAHFSEPGFGGDTKSSVLSEEIERLEKLKAAGEIEYYILFSNRRLGGVVAPALEQRVADSLEIAKRNVHFAGLERLNDLLHEHPDVIRLAKIDPIDGPLLPSSQDLAEVILAIADELVLPDDSARPVRRVSYEDKNALNAMSPEFAEELSRRYLGYTTKIRDFLADPANDESRQRYEATVEDFQLKIIAKRASYQTFDDVFNYLVDTLVKRDPVLAGRGRAKLVRAMLFYMYYNCDIGRIPDAAS